MLPPVPSSATTTTSSPSRSPPTTVRSFRVLVTVPSSSGTPWVTASTPSLTRATLSGFLACASALTPRTPSSFPPAGTSSSRYVFLLWSHSVCFGNFLKEGGKSEDVCIYVFATSEPFGYETTFHHLPDGFAKNSAFFFFKKKKKSEQTWLTSNKGLGTRVLPPPDRPHRSHRLHQHRHHLPRRLALRLRR